ncbi:MAG: YlxR family protein [Nakamurella sp.]
MEVRMAGNCPVRTCVGCRMRCSDVELLRVVVSDGELIPDPGRRLPGRGAWVHPTNGCVAMAQQRRAFARALPGSRSFDETPIHRFITEE